MRSCPSTSPIRRSRRTKPPRPRCCRRRGYHSGLFGKFHLTGSDINEANNPLGYTAVHQLGWDYFAGWQDGAPHPIDTTAGGVAATGVSYAVRLRPQHDRRAGQRRRHRSVLLRRSARAAPITAESADADAGPRLPRSRRHLRPRTACKSPVPATVNFTSAERLLRGPARHQPARWLVLGDSAAGCLRCRARLSVDHRERSGDRLDQCATGRDAVDGHGRLFVGAHALPAAADRRCCPPGRCPRARSTASAAPKTSAC